VASCSGRSALLFLAASGEDCGGVPNIEGLEALVPSRVTSTPAGGIHHCPPVFGRLGAHNSFLDLTVNSASGHSPRSGKMCRLK
jgi:hypothetical protein